MSALNEMLAENQLAREAAGLRHGVTSAIHPSDWIFWFLHSHPAFPNKVDAINNYFADGAKCADKLRTLIVEQQSIAGAHVLEFAAGYGRVTRHLHNILPDADVLACDIHPEAVAFLRDKVGVSSIGSNDVPEKLDLDRRFDVVFALSFFSHLPKLTWRRWLLALARHTAPDGLLIFTTHGERSRANLGNPEIGPDGFWFKPESEQQDLSEIEYGSTLTLPRYVLDQISGIPQMRLVRFQEGFWWGHQDVYVLRRTQQPRD